MPESTPSRAFEFVLASAGVLEFVNEQVANVVGNDECGVGGHLVFSKEDVPGDLRDFDKVNCTGFREGGLQFA